MNLNSINSIRDNKSIFISNSFIYAIVFRLIMTQGVNSSSLFRYDEYSRYNTYNSLQNNSSVVTYEKLDPVFSLVDHFSFYLNGSVGEATIIQPGFCSPVSSKRSTSSSYPTPVILSSFNSPPKGTSLIKKWVKVYCGKKCCPANYIFETEQEMFDANVNDLGHKMDFHPCVNETPYFDKIWNNLSWTEGNVSETLLEKALYNNTYRLGHCKLVDVFSFDLESEKAALKKIEATLDLFCIDNFYGFSNISTKVLFCFQYTYSYQKIFTFWRTFYYPMLIINIISNIALFCLLLMFLFSRKKDLQMKMNMSFLLAFYVLNMLTIIQRRLLNTYFEGKTACLVRAIIHHYFMFSCAFWTNVLCYDITRIIRGSLNMTTTHRLRGSKYRFLWYSLYAWGIPFLLCLVILTLYLIEATPPIIKPIIISSYCKLVWREVSTILLSEMPRFLINFLNAFLMIFIVILLCKNGLMWRCCKIRHGCSSHVTLRTHGSKTRHSLELLKQRIYISLLAMFLWAFGNVARLSSHYIFFTMKSLYSPLETFEGAAVFIILARTGNWAILKDTYARLSGTANRFTARMASKKTVFSMRKYSKTNSEVTRF